MQKEEMFLLINTPTFIKLLIDFLHKLQFHEKVLIISTNSFARAYVRYALIRALSLHSEHY